MERVALGSHPQGLAVSPNGRLLLATTVDGSVAVLSLPGKTVALKEHVKLSEGRLSGVSFTHDGRAALVGLRDEQGIVVLDVDVDKVSTARERVTSGIAPYAIDVSGDGRWAVVGNAGLAGLKSPGKLFGDADSFTLIDVSRRPFRAVQHVTVLSVPEEVAISPDGRWIAVQAMDGSNLTADNPARRGKGRLILFEVRGRSAVQVGDLPAGKAGSGGRLHRRQPAGHRPVQRGAPTGGVRRERRDAARHRRPHPDSWRPGVDPLATRLIGRIFRSI